MNQVDKKTEKCLIPSHPSPITNHQRNEIALRESENRLRRQNKVLMELARHKTINRGNLKAAIQEITEAAARTLEIERVSVWFYNNFRWHPEKCNCEKIESIATNSLLKLVCLDLYQRSFHQHSDGMELSSVNYPAYFQALETERTIAAHDAHTDPRTREFSDGYLASFGIRSMLDAPIWLGGQIVGTVCHEQIEPGRQWTIEEENFAGSIADLVSLAIEAGERKQAEVALRESEEKFCKAFHASPSAMAIASFPEGVLWDVNHSFVSVSGYSREELINRTTRELNLWYSLEDRDNSIQILLEQGAVRNLEYKFCKKSGEIVVGLFSAELINLGGKQCVLSVMNDITERKRAEAALRESEEKFRSAFRSSPDAIAINTLAESRLIEANESFLHLTGYNREEVIGHTVTELKLWVNPEIRALVRQILQEKGAIRNFEFEFRRKSGEIGVALFSAESINLAGNPCLLSVIHEITEHKQAEEKLRAAAERDRLLAQIALRIRRSLNLDQILHTTVNEVRQFFQVDRVFIGHANSSGQGQVLVESVDPKYPSLLGWILDDETFFRELQENFQHKRFQVIDDITKLPCDRCIAEYLSEYKVKAGLVVPIWVSDKLFGVLGVHQCSGFRHWQQFEIDLLEQLATQVSIAIQQAQLYEQIAAANDNLERQVQERTQELQQKMQELQELNQLKDLFLHAVTHDLRTPVMGWLLVLNNLLNQPTEQITLSRSIIERMIQSSDRQLYLINSLLEVHSSEVRGLILQQEPLKPSELVQAIITDLEPLLEKNQATLNNQIPADLPVVNADQAQLWRVFENLIANALNHNPPGLLLTLNATVEEGELKVTETEHKKSRIIRFTIQDNGVGMTPETCEHLFELYVRGSYTRRSTGIGLGLYLCRQIITAHGGEIGVNSSPGAGSTFWFTLPVLGIGD